MCYNISKSKPKGIGDVKMSGKHRRGDSSIGTATHPTQKCFPSNVQTSKRSRYKCVHYERATRDCVISRVGCVGPSNALCRNYCEKIKKSYPLKVNTLVKNDVLGIGLVVRITDGVFYVQFEKSKKLCSYFVRDIKRYENGIIYV